MHSQTLFIVVLLTFLSCNNSTEEHKDDKKGEKVNYLLELQPKDKTNIDFTNTVKESFEANYLNYEFIYNGSGVAVGDINNDGLDDIYFGGNSSDDKLYLNEGNLKFKDISSSLGLPNLKGWSTGINMVDINADGLMDIYVCRSGPLKNPKDRMNKLFINKGNLNFIESAEEYGLAKSTYSIQSAFFDYDLDGDLDMYLLNHPVPEFKVKNFATHINEVKTGKVRTDFFFENIDGKYFDKTMESGLQNFGYRHGIAVGDVNQDSYPDLYISSDFDEPDLLYINNKAKGFDNVIDTQINHISMNSMGNEIVDINNDGLLDLFIVDMAPSNHFRSKAFMKSMNITKFNALADYGFHYQYMQNTLQINNGNKTFSEVAQMAGIANSDWSWAPLFFDIDLDGEKDLFISNGIKENFLYRDIQSEVNSKQQTLGRKLLLEELLEIVPSDITPNVIFRNEGGLKFTNFSKEWMSPKAFNSNGAAYADFDNDGDLDLVVNNMHDEAALYKNTKKDKSFIKIKLKGSEENTNAIGARVIVTTDKGIQVQELNNARGYLSSVSYSMLFGFQPTEKIKKVSVYWNDKKGSELTNVEMNSSLVFDYKKAIDRVKKQEKSDSFFTKIKNSSLNLAYKHTENKYYDYGRQLLLPQKQSTKGPSLVVGDVNGDGLEDVFIGGAKDQSGELYVQTVKGNFTNITARSDFKLDRKQEDLGTLLFDADSDGDLDLYISSGGYEFNETDPVLQDRLYINNGKGQFTKSERLPEMITSTKAVTSVDYDKDGDLDLVIGGEVIPGRYPLSPRSYILENNQGSFSDVTEKIAPELKYIGMVSDFEIVDFDKNGYEDILVVGNWMAITLFTNNNGSFTKAVIPEFEKSEGWYYCVSSSDIDNDGDIDLVIGNIGANNKFHPTIDKPLHIFSTDFDNNGSYDFALSKEYKGHLVPTRGKECSSEQTPFLNDKIGSYKQFALSDIYSIYGNENISNANHLIAYNFKSLYIENLGDLNFKIKKLPIEAQMGPTLDIDIVDVNKDGFLDIIGVGNIYDAEVETIRYDASQGYVLMGGKNGSLTAAKNSGFSVNKDMRGVSSIIINGTLHIIVVSNNKPLDIFKVTQ